MKNKLTIILVALGSMLIQKAEAQVDGGQTGAWYMYFWDTKINDSEWGFQGDFQYRSWDIPGDFEQSILRGGLTYQATNSALKSTFGFAFFTSGDFGSSDATTDERRIYQDFLFPQKPVGRFHFTHRLRIEERFIENQNFRTRFRYNTFLNIPLNKPKIEKGTVYLAFYNEIFVNGQRSIGNGKSVKIFDRDWLYGGVGYAINDHFKIQFAYMRQFTNLWDNGQLQLSVHQKF